MNARTLVEMGAAYAGLSKSEIARRIGLSPTNFMKRLRNGKIPIEELEEIAKAMGGTLVIGIKFDDGKTVG